MHRVIRPWFYFWIFFALLLALVLGLSHAYWGYWFAPPELDPLTEPFAEMNSIAQFGIAPDEDGGTFAYTPDGRLSDLDFGFLRHAPYLRVPYIAVENGLPEFEILDEAELVALNNLVQAQEWVWFSTAVTSMPLNNLQFRLRENVYCVSQDFRISQICFQLPFGYVIRGVDNDGDTLLLINLGWAAGIGSGDDHYQYYEALFEQQSDGTFKPLVSNQFAFDMGNLEGLPWISAGLMQLYLLCFVALPLFVVVSVIRAIWKRTGPKKKRM